MKRLLSTPIALLLRRIALLYAVLMLCRVVFYFYNAQLLGALTWSESGNLLIGSLQFDTVSVLYANGVLIVLALLPVHLRERRWYRRMLFWYYVVVNAVSIVALNLADCVYFRYTQKRLTADELFFTHNNNSLQLIGQFMAENWYLVVVAAMLVALLVWGYGRKVAGQSILRRGWVYYAGGTVLLALVAGACLAGIRGGVTRMTRPITLSNATLYTADSGKANLILSNPFCILRTIGSGSVTYQKYFSPEELARLFTPVHRPAENTADSTANNTTVGSAVNLAGRNVVVFIMESMSAEHSAHLMPELYAEREQKGFTPFLDSLMRNGLCFTQMYANGSRSIQAMPAILGSIPSFKTPFVLMPQSLGTSRQLPAMLREQGYATSFFCGSERGSMGFGAYARSAGVDRLVSREDYEARHGTDDFDGYWGIWDEPFLQFMGEELARTPEPFFSSLFTLSSHHPFVVPARYEDVLPAGYTRIHRGVAYDDLAFRHFFERFGDSEWFARTVFVFVADHVSSEKLAPQTRTFPDNMHIMGFIYTPDGALQGQVSSVVQQADIMPTVLGLLGNTEPYFAFGRDVLNEPEKPRWSVSYEGRFQAVTDRYLLTLDDKASGFVLRDGQTSQPHGPASGAINEQTTGQANEITGEQAIGQTNERTYQMPKIESGDSPDTDPARLSDAFRAMVQQYYSHIETKRYTADD